jgi:hypothetical protein
MLGNGLAALYNASMIIKDGYVTELLPRWQAALQLPGDEPMELLSVDMLGLLYEKATLVQRLTDEGRSLFRDPLRHHVVEEQLLQKLSGPIIQAQLEMELLRF